MINQLYEFQREVLYLLNEEAAQREEEYQRRMVNNGGVWSVMMGIILFCC